MDTRALNKSQLVAILNANGIPASKGVAREVLEEQVKAFLEDRPPSQEPALLPHMTEIRSFVEQTIQSDLPYFKQQFGCDGDCSAHPDSQVCICYIALKGELP